MPDYTVRDKTTGKVVTFKWNGAEPPTEADLEQVFAAARGGSAPVPTEQAGPSMLGLAGTAAKTALSDLNPVSMVRSLYEAGRTGPGGVAWSPVRAGSRVLEGVVGSHYEQAKKALERLSQGRISEGVGHAAAAAIPLVGPMIGAAGEQIGSGDPEQMAEGVGHLGGLLAPVAATKALGRVRLGRLQNVNPAEREAVRFGLQRGVPVDAGTATGNPAVRGVQALADRSLAGSLVSGKAKQAQSAAMAGVGDDLARRVYPESVAPEQAGAGVQGAVKRLVEDLHGQATSAYDKVRAAEANPLNAETVPVTNLAAKKVIEQRMVRTLGEVPVEAELRELRRIHAEMDSLPFVKRTWNKVAGKTGNAAGGDADIVAGAAGASVYDDILESAPGVSEMTRGEVREAIDVALNSGKFTNAAKGALDVARLRLRGARGRLSTMGELPPSAGDLPVATESMALPVDLRNVKSALQPILDRMRRQLPITQQRSSPGLKAIENIVDGPDYAPLSQVDLDLSQIKGIGRGADLPELRDLSQGLAAQAVKQLDDAVRETAQRGGVADALAEGRTATVGKYQAADVLRELRDEPVQAFQQATWAKDAGVDRLRRLVEMAPGEIPKIGRAYLDDLLNTATQEGGFSRGAGIYAKWQALGPQTKKLLFVDRGLVQDLDNFFLLAKKLGENPNPSGTAYVGALGAQGALMITNPAMGVSLQIPAYALAKLLHNPRFVKAITEGMRIPVTNKPAAAAATANILKWTGERGSMAAEDKESTPATIGQR